MRRKNIERGRWTRATPTGERQNYHANTYLSKACLRVLVRVAKANGMSVSSVIRSVVHNWVGLP